MDEDMDGVVEVFEAVEVDLDYEYDAARFFDFTRPETDDEARQSEMWFEFAPSYPPSPIVAKLFPTEDLYSEIVDMSLKSTYYDGMSLADGNVYITQGNECSDQDVACEGAEEISRLTNVQGQTRDLLGGPSGSLSFYNHLADEIKKPRGKSSAKPFFPRSSTLMKPTASQLAKQNQRCHVSSSRFQKNNGSLIAHHGIENQASKRQKLDGGLLRKIVDVKQPINLIRKVPVKECALPNAVSQTKLRITIPREPELETAHRAERIRPTNIKKAEISSATTSRFRARPFNKKILEAPVQPIPKRNTLHMPDFQAFHLKTTERVKSQSSAATSTSIHHNKVLDKLSHNRRVETGNNNDKRCEAVDVPKRTACQPVNSFKARLLDRKILKSRGDLGIFRNNKRDVTVPMEFQFQTAKRNQQDPPVELFSKLSLASDTQPKSRPQLELLHRTPSFSKPSKENRWEEPGRQNQYVSHQGKERSVSCGKPTHFVTDDAIDENGPRISLRPVAIGRQQ